MTLTDDQRAGIKLAHEALEASRQSTDYAGHCGLLEYHVGSLLKLIEELTSA